MISSQNDVRKYRTKAHEQVFCVLKVQSFLIKYNMTGFQRESLLKNGSPVDRDLLKYWLFPTSSLVNQFVSVHFADMLDIQCKVINLGSDTFGNPIFSNGLTKSAILLDYKRPWMLCLALPAHRKV